MNKRDVFLVIVIAAVVGVVSSLVTSNVMVGPPTTNPKEVRANSCDVDEVCEMNVAKIGGVELYSVNDYKISPKPILYSDGFIAEEFIISEFGFFKQYLAMSRDISDPDATFFQITEDGNGFLEGQLELEKVDTKQLEVEGPARFAELIGSGNGYVCVNFQGRLYRSNTPCD